MIHADNSDGRFKWRLVSEWKNGRAMSSDSFASRESAREAAENVKAKAGAADVVSA